MVTPRVSLSHLTKPYIRLWSKYLAYTALIFLPNGQLWDKKQPKEQKNFRLFIKG